VKPIRQRSWLADKFQLLLRHRYKTTALLIVLVVVGPYLMSRIGAPFNRIRSFTNHDAQPQVSFDGKLRVVCFNIAHGRGQTDDNWAESPNDKPRRVAEIAQFLKSLDADIVVLNEVDFLSTWSGNQNQAAKIAELAGYRHYVEQRNLDFRIAHRNWLFGNVVLSRYPIANVQQIKFPPKEDWEDWLVGCKQGAVCEVELAEGVSIRVAGIHLEHRSESVRLESAKILTRLASDDGCPLFAAGDFNSTPTGFPQSNKTKEGDNALDCVISSNCFQHRPVSDPSEDELTFSSDKPRSVIDWVLIPNTSGVDDPTFTFTDYRSIPTNLSDHRAVIAEIEFRPGSRQPE
jgi:endonuclease/exonuclease/phosphatase family metal-dependent hydrolase